MPQLDRLSALMSRFELSVVPCDVADANFVILGHRETRAPEVLMLSTHGTVTPKTVDDCPVLLSAKVSWGGPQNPLLAALPTTLRHRLRDDADMLAVARMLLTEKEVSRCGHASVLNRLGEVLIVRLMRAQIEAGALQSGLLGGLADARLSRAIVAMHDRPEEAWRVETLANEAGLSVSRFAELFREAVGVTPLAYLRKWRLVLARQDIERGDRVQRVANRYCYGSTEALSRAVSQAYGVSPIQLRKAAATGQN